MTLVHGDAMWRYAEYQAEIARIEGRKLPAGLPLLGAIGATRWSLRRTQVKR